MWNVYDENHVDAFLVQDYLPLLFDVQYEK